MTYTGLLAKQGDKLQFLLEVEVICSVTNMIFVGSPSI